MTVRPWLPPTPKPRPTVNSWESHALSEAALPSVSNSARRDDRSGHGLGPPGGAGHLVAVGRLRGRLPAPDLLRLDIRRVRLDAAAKRRLRPAVREPGVVPGRRGNHHIGAGGDAAASLVDLGHDLVELRAASAGPAPAGGGEPATSGSRRRRTRCRAGRLEHRRQEVLGITADRDRPHRPRPRDDATLHVGQAPGHRRRVAGRRDSLRRERRRHLVEIGLRVRAARRRRSP